MSQTWTEAQKRLAGGVNSPVRAFKAVGGEPIFMKRGSGSFLFDRQGKKYVDYCLSWGAILLGHANPKVVKAIQKQAGCGTSFGTATEAETLLAAQIQKVFTGMEKIRLTSSGTEAVMSAIRLARGVTGRDRIVKFEGCYHGHSDSLLVKAGSGLATFGTADSGGVPEALAALTTVLPYNDVDALNTFFKNASDTACVIVEPIAGNMGLVPAKKEFLEILRKKTKENGSLLIFDEVISGFRVCHGGAQHLYGIQPDITVLGKIIGGGLPIGAFGAKATLMDALSPLGKVYQAGTLSGNPLSVAAGISVLSGLSKDFYQALNKKTDDFLKEAQKILKGQAVIARAGSMFTIFFNSKIPTHFSEVSACDQKMFKRFFHHLLKSAVYTPPSAFETSFLSAAHTSRELENTLEAYKSFRP